MKWRTIAFGLIATVETKIKEPTATTTRRQQSDIIRRQEEWYE